MRRFALLLALTLPTLAPAQRPAPPGVTMAQLVGHYEYSEEGMQATIDLRADGTFTYRIDPVRPETQEDPAESARLDGRWRTRSADKIVLENAPGAPPRLVQTAAVRDPSVRAAVTVTGPAERVAEEVGLTVDDANSKPDDPWSREPADLREGRWTRPLRAEGAATAAPTRIEMVYAVENPLPDKTLTVVALTPGGLNRFTFAYTPSPVKPFYLRGFSRDLRAGLIEVEAGQAGLPMRKTGPARAVQ